MTMTPLLDSRPRTRVNKPWDRVPELATCSYDRYDRPMGTAVRITRMAVRGVSLPNRWTDRDHWPVVRSLIPSREIFHRGLPEAEFTARYQAGLDELGIQYVCGDIEQVNLDAPPAPQRLVLLCYEDMPDAETGCHRRAFARWWTKMTGLNVPELG